MNQPKTKTSNMSLDFCTNGEKNPENDSSSMAPVVHDRGIVFTFFEVSSEYDGPFQKPILTNELELEQGEEEEFQLPKTDILS